MVLFKKYLFKKRNIENIIPSYYHSITFFLCQKKCFSPAWFGNTEENSWIKRLTYFKKYRYDPIMAWVNADHTDVLKKQMKLSKNYIIKGI